MAWTAPDRLSCPGEIHAETLRRLQEEFSVLDNLIVRKIQEMQGKRTGGQLDPFKGLVISDEEVDGLLSEPLCFPDASVPEPTPIFDPDAGRAARLEGSRLSRLSQRFHLAPFEERCLMICLAPDIDRKYARLYGYLQDDLTLRHASVGLILDLLCSNAGQKIRARQVFDARSPLFKYRLLSAGSDRADETPSFLTRSLRTDDRIADYLLGIDDIDVRLSAGARLWSTDRQMFSDEMVGWPGDIEPRIRAFARSITTCIGDGAKNRILHIYGPYGAGRKTLALSICRDAGMALLAADVRKLLNGKMPFDEALLLLGREAALQPAALALENFDPLIADETLRGHLDLLVETVRRMTPVTFLIGEMPWKPQGLWEDDFFTSVSLSVPDASTAKTFWEKELARGHHIDDTLDIGMLTGQFRFTPGRIRDAVAAAANLSSWSPTGTNGITMDDLYAACRDQSNPRLSQLARKIMPKYAWQDLVLSSEQITQLRELCSQARYRHIVYGNWGFEKKLSYGKGLTVLFAGPPGTGKTMAAEVIAGELRLDLFKIDLSQIVSKYIGETEKNLDRIFTEAQTSNAILFFDEADALFGKRSEVKDAHDRYANIEISYLLQKMEEYEGIAILATNLRANMDEAFVRRLGHVVEFPLPGDDERRRIWQRIWPSAAPTGRHLDLDQMARRFEITGGNIRNIALAAAFLAADNGGTIEMSHLMRATRREYQKMGKIILDNQFAFAHPEGQS